MKRQNLSLAPILFLLLAMTMPSVSAAASGFKVKLFLSTIQLPPGFSISIYADKVPGALGGM